MSGFDSDGWLDFEGTPVRLRADGGVEYATTAGYFVMYGDDIPGDVAAFLSLPGVTVPHGTKGEKDDCLP